MLTVGKKPVASRSEVTHLIKQVVLIFKKQVLLMCVSYNLEFISFLL